MAVILMGLTIVFILKSADLNLSHMHAPRDVQSLVSEKMPHLLVSVTLKQTPMGLDKKLYEGKKALMPVV